jgi:hypothetical protein
MIAKRRGIGLELKICDNSYPDDVPLYDRCTNRR